MQKKGFQNVAVVSRKNYVAGALAGFAVAGIGLYLDWWLLFVVPLAAAAGEFASIAFAKDVIKNSDSGRDEHQPSLEARMAMRYADNLQEDGTI